MKQIISKNMSNRIQKEAGLWDSIKGKAKGLWDGAGKAYDATQDFYNKARLGWELGKTFQGKAPWQQKMEAMMYKNMYPTDAQGNPVYKTKDPKTGQEFPHNPFFVPGLRDKMTKSHMGHGMYRLPKGKIINPAKAHDAGIQEQVQQALMLAQMGDSSGMHFLEQNQTIINEQNKQQPATQTQQTAGNVALTQP